MSEDTERDEDEIVSVVNIGDSDENADWIKTPEYRASEAAIHEELAKRYAREQGKDEEPGE
jgi:hypothetical protein